jgi:hypothetical protein
MKYRKKPIFVLEHCHWKIVYEPLSWFLRGLLNISTFRYIYIKNIEAKGPKKIKCALQKLCAYLLLIFFMFTRYYKISQII